MKRVKVEIEMDEDVIAKVRQFLGLSEEYETAEEVITEMFYLNAEGFNAVDLRHKVTVTTFEGAKSAIRKVLAEAFFVGVDEGKYSEWDGIRTDNLGPDDIPRETIDPLLNKIVTHLENKKE